MMLVGPFQLGILCFREGALCDSASNAPSLRTAPPERARALTEPARAPFRACAAPPAGQRPRVRGRPRPAAPRHGG